MSQQRIAVFLDHTVDVLLAALEHALRFLNLQLHLHPAIDIGAEYLHAVLRRHVRSEDGRKIVDVQLLAAYLGQHLVASGERIRKTLARHRYRHHQKKRYFQDRPHIFRRKDMIFCVNND